MVVHSKNHLRLTSKNPTQFDFNCPIKMLFTHSTTVEVLADAAVIHLEERKSKEGFNAEEFLSTARERAQKSLKSLSEGDDEPLALQDLPYLLQTTKALISFNISIWERCQENRIGMHGGLLSFSRVSISQIRTQQVDATTTTFYIPTTVTSKDFGAPPPVPKELADFLSVPILSENEDESTTGSSSFAGIPDYEAYLDRAALLRDEALLPFLVKLKDHLESVHVFLGNIEAWLMEPHCNARFLEDIFDGISQVGLPTVKDLIVSCDKAGGDPKCCTIPHPAASLCLQCHKPFRDHPRGPSRQGIITHLCDYWSRNVGSFLTTTSHEIRIEQCQPCKTTMMVELSSSPLSSLDQEFA